MGEVYKARDTRLDRSVAIKVLPSDLSSDPDMRARFEREARVVSGLNHPHICTLHDIGRQDDVAFIVMELLEGTTLAERLAKGPLPTDQVLRFGAQIAEALDRAHRNGIVHRDLKPSNVMLTKSGVKLLDFGLAKAFALGTTSSRSSIATENVGTPLTEKGTILGTFQYMAPEQLEGKEADARTDIFALGAVLYEMATGRKAFAAQSRASLIAAILEHQPPPVSTVQPLSPPALERVIATCLAKDPDERWQSAHDVMSQLRWLADAGSQAGAPAVVRSKRSRRERVAWGVAAVLAVAAAALGARLALRRPAAPEGVLRFITNLPETLALPRAQYPHVALSRDGSLLVYAARPARLENSELYLHPLDRFEAVKLPRSAEAMSPFFSPDGRWIGFFADGKIQKLALSGGAPVTICETRFFGGADWTEDGTILFSQGTLGIARVPASGGKPETVVALDPKQGERALAWPQLLPGAKAVLFTVWTGGKAEDSRIVAQPLAGGARRVLHEGASQARYIRTGHLLAVHAGTVTALPFDVERLTVTGAPQPALDGVMTSLDNGHAQLAVAENGTIAYIPGGAVAVNRSLVWVDRKGAVIPASATNRPYADVRLSPDGRRAAFTIMGATFDVWLLDFEREAMTRISLGGDDSQPAFTPDGERVIYTSTRSGHANLYWRAADASGPEERLTDSPHAQSVDCVAPDGSAMLVDDADPTSQGDILVVPLRGDRTPRPLVKTPFNELGARISPDGRFVLYSSNESGRAEIYAQPYPELDRKWQLSTAGGAVARWGPDGKEVFYREGDRYYVVPIRTDPFTPAKPELLFQGRYVGRFDVSSDGKRILVARENEDAPRVAIHVVTNWFSELTARPAP